ncbi:hypothetical protein SteCoe_31029 [Stentor coeruleus]|uniref:Uncharacterized protein n=1 Tax=Stentor coeruleus TaxID=5963 RepID=A0A1R2B288_9CILI|nr:hypothetical protein SteCoe_31029 [Stentor coeruleus]
MESDESSLSRGAETERNSSGNLLSQLKEKLKTQAQQLRRLESYKLLCEERILDLFPKHPLPVIRDHIGLYNNSSNDIMSLRQKIAKLEKQVRLIPEKDIWKDEDNLQEELKDLTEKLESCEKEKHELEESLRNEMRICEEQKIYIEIIKQAIEANMENLGLQGMPLDEYVNMVHIKLVHDGTRKSLNKAKNQLQENEYEIVALREAIHLKDSQYAEQKNKLISLLRLQKEQTENVRIFKEEIQKLEEEKSRLLDYIQKKKYRDKDSSGELRNSKKIYEELDKKCKESMREHKKASEDYKHLHEEYRKLAEENRKLQEEHKRILDDNKKNIEEIKKSTQDSRITSEENQKLIEENAKLKGEICKLFESLEKTRCSLKESEDYFSNYKSQVEENDKNFKDKDYDTCITELEKWKTSSDELKGKLKRTEEKVDKLQAELKNCEISIKCLEETLSESKDRYNELTDEYTDLSSKYDDLLKKKTREQGISQDNEDKERALSAKIIELKEENNRFSLELNDLQSENTIAQQIIEKSSRSSVFQDNIHKELQKTLNLLYPKSSPFLFQQNTQENSLYLIQTLYKEIEQLLKNNKIFQISLKDLEERHINLLALNEKTTHDLTSTKSKEILQRSQIENLNLEINYLKESLKSQVSRLQQEIFTLRGTIKSINDGHDKTSDNSKRLSLELSQTKYKLCASEMMAQSLEEKYDLLQNTKTRLASTIKKVQHLVGNSRLQEIIHEILRIHSEIEFSQIEKLRLTMQMRKSEDSSEGENVEAMRKQVSYCEGNISAYITRLNMLETQLTNESA